MDCREAFSARWLDFYAVRHLLGKRGELLDDTLRLGAEVDVARAGQRRLLRAVRDEELHRPLERVEELAHLRLFVGPEDRHGDDYRIRAVSGVLICADSTRSPEMRHEVPVAIPDAFLYAEQNGRRVAVVNSLEAVRINEADPGIEI